MSNGGFEKRWSYYKKLHCKKQKHLYNALKKYGPENIIYKKLVITNDIDYAAQLEQQLISVYQSNNSKYGYNKTCGGEHGMLGYKFTKEQSERLSKSLKGKKKPSGFGAKVTARLTGHINSDETKLKIKQKMLNGSSWNKGDHLSETHKSRIGMANKIRNKGNALLIESQSHVEYTIELLNGDIILVRNLSLFCRNNSLNAGTLRKSLSRGEFYKGYKINTIRELRKSA
jgi:hypothetical protein